jgi:YVTN family beta-propeller protein
MHNTTPLLPLALLAVFSLSAPAGAQHTQVSAVAVNPAQPGEVWATNRDNNSVAVVDTLSGSLSAEIAVGMSPRSLAFTPDGSRVFVANSRGNVPIQRNFASPFLGSEVRGTLSVIDSSTRSVIATLNADQVGVEPYGVAVAPSGKWFAVSGFASGSLHFFDVATLQPMVSFLYLSDLNVIPAPFTAQDVDANRDGVPDLGQPRGFVIRADSSRMYVTHNKSPYISVLDISLDINGNPTSVTLVKKLDTNDYSFDPIFNPVPVQTLKSQGYPRFLEDIALSPDGLRALIPHVLTNVNHDVNHNFGPAFAGDFANRVYPALTMIDAGANTFQAPGDRSNRLHHELSDSLTPAEYAPYGSAAVGTAGPLTLGGSGTPMPGGSLQLLVEGLPVGSTGQLWIGRETRVQMGSIGTLYARGRFAYPIIGGSVSIPVPNSPQYEGLVLTAQAGAFVGGQLTQLSNGLRIRLSAQGVGVTKMGYRAGHPGRVAFNAAGDRALMLNRGSEDLFLYDVSGSDMQLLNVFPPRLGFHERKALDTSTPLGDLPLGMALAEDPSTPADDALVYVINELTRTLSVLRVNWTSGVILKEHDQIPTHAGADVFTTSVRGGNELFEDASRPQTSGNFNNSCASCHFEGGEDANVWQRPAGPRSTMPMYGGTLATGLGLWKGLRLNVGETGPMFGGENGGTGILTDLEQKSLVDFHETIAVPLNPHLDPTT